MAEFEYFRDALTSHSFKPQPQLLTEAFFVGCFTPKFRASSLNRKTSEEPTTFAHRGDRPGKRVALIYKFALKYCGTGGRTRTDTLSTEQDFESGASTITPHPHLYSIRLKPSKSPGHRRQIGRAEGRERGGQS